jgi:large subunit ribosomal protein L23
VTGEIHLWDIIRRPVISEKANFVSEYLNQYTFEVDVRANKIQIKEAVDLIFDVEVERVNVMVMPPKRGRRGRKEYIRRPKWKKAVVTLPPGQSINLFNI